MKIRGDHWVLLLHGLTPCVNSVIKKALKQIDPIILFNDLTGEYWVYDFRIGQIWFSSVSIIPAERRMTLEVWA